MKRIKLKKKRKISFLIIVIIVITLYLILKFLLNNITFENSNSTFVTNLLNNSNAHLSNKIKTTSLTDELLEIFKIDLNNPITILDKNHLVYKEQNQPQLMFTYMNNQNIVSQPIVYLYNTHPTEYYIGEFQSEYNLKPGVLTATYLLQEKLNSMGINTIVEENNVYNHLINTGLSYDDSYEVSRMFLEEKLKQYPDLKLIIDIHRDAVSKEIVTTTINGKSYAKVMLVMNTTFPNYNKAFELTDLIENNYPTLTRNVYDKIYHFNQDLNTNIFLLELGGDKNTYEEVLNTVDALALIIKEYLNE